MTYHKQQQELKNKIEKLLYENDGNRSKVAKILGLPKSTFHDKLMSLGIGRKHSFLVKRTSKYGNYHSVRWCVYLITSPLNPGVYKIGKTKNLNNRMSSLNSSVSEDYILCKVIYCKDKSQMNRIEQALHTSLCKHRVPNKAEFFELSREQVDNISDYLF